MKSVLFVIDTPGSGGAQTQLDNTRLIFERNNYSAYTYYTNISSLYPSLPSLCRFFLQFFYLLRFVSGLPVRPLLIVSFLESPSFYSSIVAFIFSVRCIISVRNDISFANLRSKILLYISCSLADVVTTNSVNSYYILVKSFHSKVFFISNGHADRSLNPSSPRSLGSPIRLCFVARVCPQKQQIQFLQVLKSLSRYPLQPSICVDFIGRLDQSSPEFLIYSNKFLSLLASFNSSKISVRYRGLFTSSELHSVYTSYDFSILNSSYEGIPNSVCESLMHSVPAIIPSNLIPCFELTPCSLYSFDSNNPSSLCLLLNSISRLSSNEYLNLCHDSRLSYSHNFSLERLLRCYNQFLPDSLT